nr:AAA family ATPase [Actinopolyspora biskrensis]
MTGGPGAGKSTLIERLASSGYACVPEAGRRVIREQSSIGGRGVPWEDPELFAELMLSRELASYEGALRARPPVFCDRGIPDIVGFLRVVDLPVPRHLESAAARSRYHRLVFVAPFWPEIYRLDDQRAQSPEEARRTCRAVVDAYVEYGYEPVLLPCCDVDGRVRFVRETLAAGGCS